MTAPRLSAMTKAELRDLMEAWGEKRFRADQVFRAVQKEGRVDPDAITTLPVALRERLHEATGGPATTLVEAQRSDDGTIKYLFELADGKRVEDADDLDRVLRRSSLSDGFELRVFNGRMIGELFVRDE